MSSAEEVTIDGSMGEGGGQVLRTALTLSMCLQRPISIANIRAGRRKPGLLRQHLTAVRAAAAISGAVVDGAELGARSIRFAPSTLMAGHYEFRIGSAGSTTLVMQTILPALSLLDAPSTVVIHGGTHNSLAPSVDFIELALLPLLARMGLRVRSTLVRHGFNANGGGEWRFEIEPWREAAPLELTERGAATRAEAVATISNLQPHIAERELDRVAKRLGWAANALTVRAVPSISPGNVLSLRCGFEGVTEVFESVGMIGVSAERVAGRAIRDARSYLAGSHAVGEFLADQLLLPMVLGQGGAFTTGALSSHARTNMALIEQMLGAAHFEVVEEMISERPHATVRILRGLALAR